MNVSRLVLFVHIVGAIGIFATLIVWLFGVGALRRARRVEQVRALASLIARTSALAVGSIALTGIAGIYLSLTFWNPTPAWTAVATVSFIALAPIGAVLLEPRMRALAKQAEAEPDGPLPVPLQARAHDRLLALGVDVDIALLLGILFLMVNKPPLAQAVAVMVIVLAGGIIVGLLPSVWRVRTASAAP
jgi:hypothetical protein